MDEELRKSLSKASEKAILTLKETNDRIIRGFQIGAKNFIESPEYKEMIDRFKKLGAFKNEL